MAYATRCGSTAEVAKVIAEALCAQGTGAEARNVREVSDLGIYDGVVLGSAIRMGKPLRDARRFVRRHAAALAMRPMACFCVCATMKDDTPENRQTAEASLASLVKAAPPVSIGLFGGCLDYAKLGPVFRFVFSRSDDEGLSQGDFRDWDAIRSWANSLPTLVQLR